MGRVNVRSAATASILLSCATTWTFAQPRFAALDAYAVYSGDDEGDWFGAKVYAVGDVDADGFEDIAVAARYHDANGENAGRLYVYSGATGATLHVFDGEGAGDEFGHRLAPIGDVNGDGHADILVGAYEHSEPGFHTGRVYVYSGATGTPLHVWTGEAPGDLFGWCVENAGDTDGDGVNDVLVAALGHRFGAGKVHLFSGRTGARRFAWDGQAAGDSMGYRAVNAGDVNGDGRPDVVIGAPGSDESGQEAGKVFVYGGRFGVLLHTLHGEKPGDRLGDRVETAGDVNADGFDDILAASLAHNTHGFYTGRVYVVSGSDGATLHVLDGEGGHDWFGRRLGAAGDLDADGHADVYVGAHFNNAGGRDAGRAYAFSGRTGEPLIVATGEGAGDKLGWDFHPPGDLNGDGFDDLLVTAPYNDGGGNDAGRLYAYSGRTGTLLFHITGESAGDLFGYVVNSGGDIDRDGLPDFTAGAIHNDAMVEDGGRGYVYRSRPIFLGHDRLEMGQVGRVHISAARPGEYVHLMAGTRGIGLGPRLEFFGGLRADILAPIEYVGADRADDEGRVEFEGVIPRLDCTTLYFQALVRRGDEGETSVKSNPIAAPLEH